MLKGRIVSGKIVSILLAATMMAGCILTGCGSGRERQPGSRGQSGRNSQCTCRRKW